MLLACVSHTVFYASTPRIEAKVVEEMEFISHLKPPQDALFGIANVHSLHNTCNITVGYYLNDTAITILAPGNCRDCKKMHACTRVFATQILRKYNQTHGYSKVYFLL